MPITNVFVVKPPPFGLWAVHISWSSIIHAVMYAGSTLYLGLGNYCFVALLFLVVVQKASLHVNKFQFFNQNSHGLQFASSYQVGQGYSLIARSKNKEV